MKLFLLSNIKQFSYSGITEPGKYLLQAVVTSLPEKYHLKGTTVVVVVPGTSPVPGDLVRRLEIRFREDYQKYAAGRERVFSEDFREVLMQLLESVDVSVTNMKLSEGRPAMLDDAMMSPEKQYFSQF